MHGFWLAKQDDKILGGSPMTHVSFEIQRYVSGAQSILTGEWYCLQTCAHIQVFCLCPEVVQGLG